ncbi:MAG: LexA family protein [Parachlamydiaceae bacterium]
MGSGGKRTGAGRPKGSGKFGIPTRAIRVPENVVDTIEQLIQHQFYRLPFYQGRVAAGFPSPADDEIDEKLDLNELLIKHPAATFFLRVSGSSMIGAGIHHNDILVVDRSITPMHGKIVIAAVNGELTVKRLFLKENQIQLVAENPAYAPIQILEGIELHIWGVVTSVIHPL